MSTKLFLVLMTAIAVVSDSMLHPFYPQYFAEVFGIADPQHVGRYIAACSLTVMLSFPIWARLSKRIHVLRLLVGTQIATGVLSVASYATTSLVAFWLVSLCMMVFKASYLLIYPYAMSIESKEQHIGTVSLLAFVVYFGNILAALLSGLVFQLIEARFLFVAMAVGDVLQIALCLYLLRRPAAALEPAAEEESSSEPEADVPRQFVAKLGAIMLVMYFSAYLTEPFFSQYWEERAGVDNKIVSGVVFAIPGMAALLGLFVNARSRRARGPYDGIVAPVLLGMGSLWLQASGSLWLVLLGRFACGWALFQCMVRLDLLLFRVSRPESYSVDFSKINVFQGLGVLLASSAAGSLVSMFGAQATFAMASGGFALGVLMYCTLFRRQLWPASPAASERAAVGAEGAVT